MGWIFVSDFVMHFTDWYLVVWVRFHSGCLLLEFPAEFEYCFDERFVLQWGSGHFGDLWVFMIVSVCAMGGGVCEGGANFAHRLTVPIISEVNRSPKVFIQAVI